MLTIVLGYKTRNRNSETPTVLYCGNDGAAGKAAGAAARQSGEFRNGYIGRVFNVMLIPMGTLPATPRPAAAEPAVAPAVPAEDDVKKTPRKTPKPK